jgi:uncharacterized protein GlcG (DUF336 family)
VLVLLIFTTGPAAQPVLGKDITLPQAQALIEAEKAKAIEQVTLKDIAFLEAGGNLKDLRIDDAFPGSFDISVGKATTACLFNISPKDLGELPQPGNPLFEIKVMNGGIVIFCCGELLKDKARNIIGAVGISVISVENDIAVAKIGVAGMVTPIARKPSTAKTIAGDVSLDQAQRMIEMAKVEGGNPRNSHGPRSGRRRRQLKVFARMDGAFLGSLAISIRREKAARHFNMSTMELGDPRQPLYGDNRGNQVPRG